MLLESSPVVQQTDHRLLVFVLKTDFERNGYTQAPQLALEPEAQLQILAATLSISPLWAEMPRAVLVARPGPDPLLAVIGYFDAVGRARLEALRWQLDSVLPHIRYVDYAQAEKDCERLAARLVECYGRDGLEDFGFTAIPRGGFIVLGMLAYVLGLQQSQLEPLHSLEAPLVVVDDYAGSGLRFGRFLERLQSRRVVFAHLYSHPNLRTTIEARESRVEACLSAHDLRDCAPAYHGAAYHAWRKRWLVRMDPRAYWVGEPDPVCFAWNEPESAMWNPVTEKEELGWRLVPPELCLKNRFAAGTERIQVQVQPEGEGPLKPSSHLLFGELEGHTVLGDLKSEESFVLDGVAGDMWQAIVRQRSLEEAAETLAGSYEVDKARLRTDLRGFVDDLLARGLLKHDG